MIKKIYPVGVIKRKGSLDVCLTLKNEINWMKILKKRLKKPIEDNDIITIELTKHISSLNKILNQLKRNKNLN